MENNFDKFFKDKLEDRQFEMKPEYWEGAEALIDADARGRNWRRFFAWFGLVMITSLAIFFVWKNDNSNDLVEKEKTTNVTLDHSVIEELNETINNDKNIDHELITTESNQEQNSKKDDSSSDVNLLLESNQSIKNNQNKTLLQSKIETTNTTLPNPNQPNFLNTIPSSEGRKSSNKNLNSEGLPNNNNTSTKNTTSGDLPIVTLDDSKSNENKVPFIEEVTSSQKDEFLQKEKEATVQPIASSSTILLPFLEMFLANNKKVEEIDLNSVWTYNPPRNKFTFGGFGGAVGYPLVENSSETPFIGFKAGFIFERNFQMGKANMALGTELTYHYRSGNFVATKQNEVARYSFGRSVAQAKLTPENLHYLEIPLYLKYQKERMTIETGASFNYLLGVRGTVTEVDETSQSGWVPSLGFKKNHVNVLLGFHYRISDNLHIGVRANYTPGGILDKNAILPEGITVALQESRPLYLTFRVTQYLKLKK